MVKLGSNVEQENVGGEGGVFKANPVNTVDAERRRRWRQNLLIHRAEIGGRLIESVNFNEQRQ
jgi:hypothetical protein